MIEREDLKYLKNIVDLQNKNVNYRTLDDIVYCIKEDDQFGFMHNILSATNDKLDYRLLDNVLTVMKKEPDVENILMDSFSTPQVNAKMNIKNEKIKSIFESMQTRLGNCIDFIRNTNARFDYIYFDFMFNNKKSSLPSKKEQFLRKIVKTDIRENLDIVRETLIRVSNKIIIKEHISSNDYKDFDIINTYKGKTVKYHLLKGKK